MMLERATFLLAFLGYAALAAAAVMAASGRVPAKFWRAGAAVILLHVVLVWAVRYRWSFAAATREGYARFVVFHAALALILLSLFLREPAARVLVLIAFAAATFGALGAVFRRDEVAIYRIPVVLAAAAGVAGIGWNWRVGTRRKLAPPKLRRSEGG